MKAKFGKPIIFLVISTGLVWTSILAAPQTNPQGGFERPAFWGTRLVNLPTTQTIDKGHFLFRVSHRFIPEVTSGSDFFFGLDGPANVLLGLGYGLSDNLSLSLSRTNLFQEVETGLDWLMSEQKKGRLPFSASLHVGGSLVTRSEEGEGLFSSKHLKFNAQLSLARQFGNRLSLLVVPAFSSNVNHWETPSKGTLSLGLGGRFMILRDFSAIVEWIPVLSGYREDFSGLAAGFELKIGGHVFQLFILSSSGLTSDQFVPGGDLDLIRGGFHLGFNIFRAF